MPVAHPIITNFTAGELSPRLHGRPDLAKYGNGAKELTNIVVLPHGGARKRGGTRWAAQTKDNGNPLLISFSYNLEQTYKIEFGPNYARFFKDHDPIYDLSATITDISKTNPCVITAANTMSVGDPVFLSGIEGMTELNNREFPIIARDANSITIDVDSSNFTTYSAGGNVYRIYEVYTVYSVTDIENLTFAQNADTLFIFSPQWPIAKMVRHAHADWDHEWCDVVEGPFKDINDNAEHKMSLDVMTGQAVITSSLDYFEEAHIGSLLKVWESCDGNNFGYARWAPGSEDTVGNATYWEYGVGEGKPNVYYVLSGGGALLKSTAGYPTFTEGEAEIYYGGGTATMRYEHSGYVLVRIDDIYDTKNAIGTIVGKYRTPYTCYGARSSMQWQMGAWNDLYGYPSQATFHEQRLVCASTDGNPETVWGSKSTEYLNFKPGSEDNDGYSYTIASEQVDSIKGMSSGRVLMINTASSEYAMGSSSSNEPLTPSNVNIRREMTYGCTTMKPTRVGPAVLFGQRHGDNSNPAHKIRELVYSFETDSFTAPDLTILSEHITRPGVTQLAYCATPNSIVWFRRTDGVVIGLTYERDQQVVAWHRHTFPNGKVLRVCASPGENGDECWMVVERTINGQTKRYIEWWMDGLQDDDPIENSVFLDCSLTYDGIPTTTVKGLNHLAGMTVDVLADGIYRKDVVISAGGTLTLTVAASKITIGIKYKAKLRTLTLEAGGQDGTALNKIKRIPDLGLMLYQSLGGTFGSNDDDQEPIIYRTVDDPPEGHLQLFTGIKQLELDGGWDRDGQMQLEHDEPYPLTINAIMPQQRIIV